MTISDRRYRTARWRRLRARILRLANGKPNVLCVWPDAEPHLANAVNHIRPVYVGMPDIEFYDPANLEPMCQAHNSAEGFLRAAGDARWGDRRPPKLAEISRFRAGPPGASRIRRAT